MKVDFKNKFNKILVFVLSINAISLLLYFFSKNILNNFNSNFFKSLGFSIFSVFIILLFLFLIFLNKISKFKIDEFIKKIILITVNLSLIMFSLAITIKTGANQENQNKLISYSQNNIKDEALNQERKTLNFYKDSFYLIKNKILNKRNSYITNLSNTNGVNNSKIKNIETPKKKKNVLLITIDSVTPFHLELNGYKRETIPNISKFAKKSLQLNKAFSQGPNTRPAIASLMTSKYVTEIFWSNRKSFIPLKQENLTFAEILQKEGYETYGVVTHSYFLKKFGYNQGFKYWDMDLISLDNKTAFEQETARRIYKKFKNIETNMDKTKPSFIWLHFFDPHDTYVKRKEATDWGNKIVDLYDNEIKYTDIYLGKLFKYLEDKKILDDYIVIITSDHGEAFGSHGYMRHGRSVYNDQLWVPLIMKFPGVKHQVIEHEVSHIDIVPTVLDYLKIDKYNKGFSGSSIFKKIKNDNFPPVYSLLFKKGKNQYTISYKGYKLNYTQKQDMKKLFDLRNDMDEKKNIADQHPEILYDLWRRLSKWIKIQNRLYKERNYKKRN